MDNVRIHTEAPAVYPKAAFLDAFPVHLSTHYIPSFEGTELHCHDFIEICYVASGAGWHQIRGEVHECKKGDIYILDTGVAHCFFADDDSKTPRMSVKNLLFIPEFIYNKDYSSHDIIDIYNSFTANILTSDTAEIKVHLSAEQFDAIEAMYRDIEYETTHNLNGRLAVINAQISIFLIKLARFLEENAKNRVSYLHQNTSIVDSALKYIAENYFNSDLTIDTVARNVHTGRSYLSRLFKRDTGEHFSEYLKNYRYKEVCRLLANTNLTNDRIVSICGFNDVPTFYSGFKKYTGTTPKKYRAENKNYYYNMEKDKMNSTERVRNAILGKSVDRTPIYGWVSANISREIAEAFGSVEAFEDKYEFDAAHIFGGPGPYNGSVIDKIRRENDELTPDLLVDVDFFTSPDNLGDYNNIISSVEFHKKRGRFCYIQTPGFFESFNGIFGIENQLCYLAMYTDEIADLYRRQADWTIKFAGHCIDLGLDMIHISDDWGAQNSLMFSPEMWYELIYPNIKRVVDFIHSKGCLASLHSDGCVISVADGIADVGFDLVHPWQEDAGMSYDTYLEKYSNKFAILGGICIQSTLGFNNYPRLNSEIHRIFSLLKNKRWICCTTHFVQNHCTIQELTHAYDLIYKLSRE